MEGALKRDFVVLGGFGEGVVGVGLRSLVGLVGCPAEDFVADRFGVEEEFDFALGVFLPAAAGEAVGEFDVLAGAEAVGIFAGVAGEFDGDVVGEPVAGLFEDDQAFAEAFLAVGFGFFDEVDDAADDCFTHVFSWGCAGGFVSNDRRSL